MSVALRFRDGRVSVVLVTVVPLSQVLGNLVGRSTPAILVVQLRRRVWAAELAWIGHWLDAMRVGQVVLRIRIVTASQLRADAIGFVHFRVVECLSGLIRVLVNIVNGVHLAINSRAAKTSRSLWSHCVA